MIVRVSSEGQYRLDDTHHARLDEPVAVRRLLGALIRGDQLGEHSGQRVDLVAAQLGAGGEARRMLGDDALEAEHERVARLPLRRG